MRRNPTPTPISRWYREPWPWIVMAGPAAVLAAGAITTWIAVATKDALVADDYYKQGLAINRVIAREQEAARLGISAHIEARDGTLRLTLAGKAPPEVLFLTLSHGTRTELDQRLRLVRAPKGAVYEAPLPAMAPGRWLFVLEDARGEWRLSGPWSPA